MARPTVKRFYRGLNSDQSLTEHPQESFLDGHNIRLTRREEGTLWAANLRGDEETFNLSEGFIPIGSEEFDGFLFIFSVNPSNGLSEIGSYPAPLNGTIQRVYRPLQNYTTQDFVQQIGDDCLLPNVTNLGNLTTELLNFRCDKPMRIISRLDFDGSVNLYFTDNFNPWRVINSGFTLSTGESNRRYITAAMIQAGYINGINESDKIPVVEMLDTPSGGRLLVGNYFFFVRYTDLNFLSTSFLGQSGPVPLFNSTVLGTTITFGGEADSATDKAVNLLISNLEPSIGFFEIGYIRYYGQDQFETFLIDKRYSITGATFRQVKVTGNEPLVNITLEDLIVSKPADAVFCKDLTQVQNQLFIANTRGPQLDHPDLRRFMCSLSLKEGYTNNGPAPEIRNDQNVNPYSINPNDTEEKVGYYSGETYIFACIPVFKGGFEGLPYPMTGVDNYNALASNANKQGIYRFKKAQIAPYWDGTDTYIKSIIVNNAASLAIYNASAWLQENLIGIKICRSERNKILLYQGLSLRCYNGKINPQLQRYNRSLPNYEYNNNTVLQASAPVIYLPDIEDWSTDRVIPLFEPASYDMVNTRDNAVAPFLGATGNYNYFHYARPYNMEQRNDFTDINKLGIFSTDYYIDKVNVPDTAYIQLVGTTNYSSDWKRESTGLNPIPINNRNALNGYMTTVNGLPPDPILDATISNNILPANRGRGQTFVGYNQLNINYQVDGFSTPTVNVVGWNAVPNQNFVSRFDEGKLASQDGLYFYQRNIAVTGADEFDISLPMATPDYIGVLNAPTYNPVFDVIYDHFADKWDRAIVNVCRSNPDFVTYTDLYDFKNTLFYPIGDFQEIGDFLATPEHEYFRGDCIVNRSYIKLVNGSNEGLGSFFVDVLSNVEGSGGLPPDGNGEDAQEDLLRGYGHWVSMVTETSYNANYRHELGRNLFYPKTNPQDPGKEFAWLVDSPESYFYNNGYINYLGPKSLVGIDLLQPVSDNKFPTRIRPSITHIFGAVRDGYRQFIPIDAKDFDYSFGEIQAIAVLMDTLYSFQNRAINLHPVNERVTQQGSQGSTSILGESQGLTKYKQIIKTGYGTQHRFSVILANQAIYAIDWNKRAILRVAGNQVEILDVTKQAQTWFRKIVALGSTGYSDALEILPNEHPCGLGIHGIYNRKYKEVLWTLRMGQEDKTICFSEEADAFVGTRGFKPIHYALVEEDLYAFEDHRAFLKDRTDKYNTFFGVTDNWFVEVVFNEGAELAKYWSHMIINSNNRVFSKIEYETQHQTAIQDPFLPISEFWYAPTYRENQWRLPIRRQDATKEPEESIYDDFGPVEAALRGRYLKVKITYDQDKELWVREIISFYNPSFT